MTQTQFLRSAGRGLTYGVGVAAGVYAAYTGATGDLPDYGRVS